MIAYTIEEALKSKYITNYIVSTDDEEIKRISESYNAEVPFIRPSDLSTDKASSADALNHAILFMEKKLGYNFDYIIELMATNPLKNVYDIDACIEKLIKYDCDSVIAVHKLEDHHPIRIKKIIDDKIVDFCLPEKPESRRQDLKPSAYIEAVLYMHLKKTYY